MKWIFLLLSCLNCAAQFPYSGTKWSVSSSSIPDYTNTLYIDLESDTSSSLGGYVNGNVVVWWTNIAPFNPSVVNNAYSPTTSSAVFPTFSNTNTTPTGQPYVNFHANNSAAPHFNIKSAGSNQPNTVIAIMRMVDFNTSTLLDVLAGSRSLLQFTSLEAVSIYSGSSLNTANSVVPNNTWFLITCVYNNTTSYIRTNGVFCVQGATSTAGWGSIFFGNDQTLATPWKNHLAAFRIYQENMATNNLHTAEQNLATRYLGITLPSP